MFTRIARTAGFAGLLAALLLTLMQSIWISPLIEQAEVFESAAAENLHQDHAAPDGHHEHEVAAWEPEPGWQRLLSTTGGNLVVALGFALMLAGLYTVQAPSRTAAGLLWGLAGYAVFTLAPTLGLPPELPGTAAADLSSRQLWWVGSAASAAVGLGLIAFAGSWPLKLAGAALMAIPHVIGAPQPPVHESVAPEALQAQFRWAAQTVNLAFWLVLGLVSAWLFRRAS
ncbi:CbtA family protein [Pseudomonas sp. DC3200b2]|uniref:CbtA family protein n=1 Tax=Pseudomonas sp. DC3200b2 TaxID=2804669 RepID=UPI003CEB51C3